MAEVERFECTLVSKLSNIRVAGVLLAGFTLKMESVSKNTIFSLKMMVKSGLEKIFLKFLHAGDYFLLLCKIAKITNSVIKITRFQNN